MDSKTCAAPQGKDDGGLNGRDGRKVGKSDPILGMFCS